MATNQQDVRVKLSAEGMAEVIQAFQKVSDAAKKSGKETETAFAAVNKQFSELGRNLVGGLGIAVVADKLAELFNKTLESAEAMTRLRAQTGLSTDAQQALGRAARETGIDMDAVNSGIVRFTASTGKAEIGSKQSADALADLGLKAKDLASLTADQRIVAVATALSKIPDPARRARDEAALFGRAGVELDQALVKVGTEGLDPFLKKLQDLGLYLDTNTIKQMLALKEQLRDAGDQVKGLATQFLSGLVPALSAAVESMTKATTGGGISGFQQLGKIVGTVFDGVVLAVETIGKAVGATVAIISNTFIPALEAAALATTGNFKAAGATIKEAIRGDAAIVKAFAADVSQTAKDLFQPKVTQPDEAPKVGSSLPGGNTSQAAALAKARYALLAQQLDNELKLYETHSKLLQDINDNQYKDGLISLQDYYAKRAAIIQADFDKRLDVLQRKAAAEAALPIADSDTGTAALAKQTAQAKLQGEIADLTEQRAEALRANTNAQDAAQQALDQRTIAAQEKLLTLEGRKQQAAELRLAADTKALDLELRQGGVPDADRTAAVSGFQQQGQAKISFDATQQNASAQLSSLTTAQKALQDQVRDGQLFSIDAQQKLIELDKARLPALQQEAAQLLAIAQQTKDPQLIAQAEQFNQKVQEIAVSTNQVGQQMAALRAGVESAVGAGLNTFLNDALSGTKKLKDTFRDTALSIVNDLEKIAEKALEQQILKMIFGAAGGGGSGGGAVSGIVGAIASGFAGGGLISGPGTSTSDSIPIAASTGEFIVNAKAVSTPGMRPLLEAINGGQLKGSPGTSVPKYAAGGLVSGGGGQTVHKIVNVLDPSTLGDHLATQAGEQAVLNVISKHPTKIRNALS